MPFFGKKKDVDYKARLEHKLYLARVDPEPIFDLSECDLKSVPSGTYLLCKVLRKEHLLLQCNQLSRLQNGGNINDLALLITLDLHSNKFTALPLDICSLRNLQELNISNNLLKVLPDELCELSSLKSLDVSSNKLKMLPFQIGNLKQLQIFKAQSNKQLHSLPNSLGKLKCSLQVFEIDVNSLEYPPREISLGGPASVIKYLAEAFELLHGSEICDEGVEDESDVICGKEHWQFLSVNKQEDLFQEDRIKELMIIEKELQEQKEKEFELQKRNKEEKDKLLEDILQKENCLHNKLVEFQVQKDAERMRLIENLQKVEDESDHLLENLLKVTQTLRNPTLLQELDRIKREEMLSLETQQIHHKEVLEAMERMLAEELERNDKLMNYKNSRESSFRDTLLRAEEMEQQLMKTVFDEQNIRADSDKWLAELNHSCGKQGMALGILLEKTDIQSQALLSEVTLVQQQLAALTSVELQRKQLNTDQRLNELSCRRVALSELLVDLLNQQDERRKQLLQTLVDVQEKKQVQNSVDDDFWLQQYQHLMDQCPESLVNAQRSLDPLLVHYLVQANAAHCLPYLAACPIQDISDKILLEMGVSEQEISAIIYAVEMYKEEKSRKFAPSAPMLLSDVPGPSAPPAHLVHSYESIGETEESECNTCVICMDKQYQIVFIPCGHLCVCMTCVLPLRNCPLCRKSIDQKIRVIVP
ncbi:E3 ubiquitin-protein ligase LRSAM1-like isoform X2 [Lycorma delicatula]|uniref:E3 ubiquitin-protein ligase LRSAM1-like isoform X2 n=1 Tax=Lycorma delicatula TaxID=130591 RepID=UPI003F5187EF